MHFSLAYVFLAALLVLVLYFFSGEKVSRIIRVLIPSFIVLLLVPVIDIVTTGGQGEHIAYIFPEMKHSIFYYYFTFFSGAENITTGMRVEIFIVTLWAFFYFRIKRKSVFISLLGALSVYSAIFFVLVTPYVWQVFSEVLVIDIKITSHVFICYFLLLLFPLGTYIGYLADKRCFMVLIKDLRWLRLLHFELMVLLGAILSGNHFELSLLPGFILIGISILFFWLFSIMVNNLSDIAIDKVSNAHRPLITGKIDIAKYKTIACIIPFFSLIYVLAVNAISFFIIMMITIFNYVYSVWPFRLKRVLLFSKFIIATISLCLVILGHINMQGNLKEFPEFFIWFFLIGFALAANFIDIKDYKGDKSDGIDTVPVVFGLFWGKLFIGIAFFLTSMSLYFYFKKFYLLPFYFLIGSLGFYFINQKKYREWRVLSLYLFTILLIIGYLLVEKVSL